MSKPAQFKCFVTGTDTAAGKTHITLGLMTLFARNGYRVAGMKPVASGSKPTKDGPRNGDALLICEASGNSYSYYDINPYPLLAPIAPYLAARQEDIVIEETVIVKSYQSLANNAEVVIVEGIGGWRMQLNDKLQMAELVKNMQLPVILVVGIRLGCINHALLTSEAIIGDGVKLLGWVGNCLDGDHDCLEGTLGLLSENIAAPKLGVIPYMDYPDSDKIANNLQNFASICLPGQSKLA